VPNRCPDVLVLDSWVIGHDPTHRPIIGFFTRNAAFDQVNELALNLVF